MSCRQCYVSTQSRDKHMTSEIINEYHNKTNNALHTAPKLFSRTLEIFNSTVSYSNLILTQQYARKI